MVHLSLVIVLSLMLWASPFPVGCYLKIGCPDCIWVWTHLPIASWFLALASSSSTLLTRSAMIWSLLSVIIPPVLVLTLSITALKSGYKHGYR